MSTHFYYHDESESWFFGDEIVSGSPEVIEYNEAEWNKELVKFCLETKVLPVINGMEINAVLLKPKMHAVTTIHRVDGGSWILAGSCHLYPSFRDGFEVHTTLVQEWLPGGIVKTATKTYLIELGSLEGEYPRLNTPSQTEKV